MIYEAEIVIKRYIRDLSIIKAECLCNNEKEAVVYCDKRIKELEGLINGL